MANIKLTESLLLEGYRAYTATTPGIQTLLPVLHQLDQAGYYSVAVWDSKTYKDCILQLEEDPWQRLRRIRQEMPNTKLQMTVAGQSLFGNKQYADDVVAKFIAASIAHGIQIVRVYDPLNNILNVEQAIKIALREKAHVQGALCYAASPVHSTAYFVGYAKQLAGEGVHSLCLYDTVGQLSPYGTYDLVRELREATGLPIQVHTRDTLGLAEMSYLKAAEAGAEFLDTALSPFSGARSLPSTQSMIAAVAGSPYTTLQELSALQVAEDYIREVWDTVQSHYVTCWSGPVFYGVHHQLSSDLVVELQQTIGKTKPKEYLQQLLKEVARLRTLSGQPTLVPPLGEILREQAKINLEGEVPFTNITPEFKEFVAGRYGRTPAVMDVSFRQEIIGETHPLTTRPADQLAPDVERLREELPTDSRTKGEDIFTLAFFPEEAPEFFKARDKQVSVLEELDQRKSTDR